MGKAENKVADYLKAQVNKRNGIVRKLQSPSHNGFPDYVIILPRVVWFVETKTPEGKLSTLQMREMKRINTRKNCAYAVYSYEHVKNLMASYDAIYERLRAKNLTD